MAFLMRRHRQKEREKLEAQGWKFADKDCRLPIRISDYSACFGWSDAVKLSQSAEKGQCLCCTVAFKAFINVLFNGDVAQWGKRFHSIRVKSDADKPLPIQKIEMDVPGGQIELCTLSGKPQAPWTNLSVRRNISGNTGSQEAFNWAAACYDDCLNHKDCSTSATATLPSRVVDIGLGANTHHLDVRLHESENEVAKYCTLSHCWGKNQILKTTEANLNQHKSCIPWTSLSKTFQEAITFARSLKIQYIWIDSLCIIQDDHEDWKRESSKMFYIYSNSVLTIAATKSASGDGGCFDISNKQYLFRPVQYDYYGERQTIYARMKLGHEKYRRNMRQRDALPLLERGWVLQERFSSPRVIHFGPEGLVFECRTKIQCECGGADAEENSSKQQHVESMRVMDFAKLADYYRKLVVSYNRLQFTYESDRLQAFQGILSQFQSVRQDDVLVSGVWKKSLTEDLLWHVHQSTTLLNKTRRGLFPSWSWASSNSHIEYLHGDDSRLDSTSSQIKIVSLTPEALTVSGYSVHARIAGGGGPNNIYNLEILSISSSRPSECTLEADFPLTSEQDGRYYAHGKTLCCFLLAKTSSWTYSWVLVPVDSTGNVYERIGICRVGSGNGKILYGPTSQLSTITVL